MIEIYDVIESLSSLLSAERKSLILHRSMRVHPKFKVYKKFCYDLYVVKGKEKKIIHSFEETRNTPADDILTIWKECDKLYLNKLMKWVVGDEFKAIINGTE